MTKIGLVGLGVMGINHARVLYQNGALHSVCDINKDRAFSLSGQYNVQGFSRVAELLDCEDIDAIVIATPTDTHCNIAIKCMEHGYDVLVEKPLASSLADAVKINECAQRYGRTLAVGYIERYNPAFRALCSDERLSSLGRITSLNIKRVGGLPRSANNVILDLMTHDINLLQYLLRKEPRKVYTSMLEHNGIVDSAQVLFDFEGLSATCESNWISPIKRRIIQVTGTSAYCEVDLISQTIRTFDEGGETIFKLYKKEPLQEELQAFIRAIETNSPQDLNNLVLGDEACRTLETTLRAAGILNDK